MKVATTTADTESWLGGAHGAALLEAFPAEDWAALRRTEGNGGVLAALRTGGLGLRAHLCGAAATARACTFSALGFATFATFGFVFEAFVGEEHLFTGRKDKLRTTLGTLQDLIVEFHEPPPWPSSGSGDGAPCTKGPGDRIPRSGGNRYAASLGLRVRAATQPQLLCFTGSTSRKCGAEA